jgi:prophage antirepressor-like protein
LEQLDPLIEPLATVIGSRDFVVVGMTSCALLRDGNEQFSKGVQTMSKIVQPTEPANHIAVFQESAIRRAWHAEEWWFSVIDVVGVLSESNNPNRYWSDLKRKLAQEAGSGQPYEKIVRLKLTAPDGKQRDTDCANTETLFRVIQSIPSPRAEPFKRWLAQVGYERVKEIENPELASARKSSTGAWQLASSSLAMLYRLIEVICRLQIHPKFCRSP